MSVACSIIYSCQSLHMQMYYLIQFADHAYNTQSYIINSRDSESTTIISVIAKSLSNTILSVLLTIFRWKCPVFFISSSNTNSIQASDAPTSNVTLKLTFLTVPAITNTVYIHKTMYSKE